MKKVKEFFADYAMVFLVILMTVVVGIIFGKCEAHQEEKERDLYNNGICTECENGHYFFSGVSGRKSERMYYYTCDKCDHTIEVHELQK